MTEESTAGSAQPTQPTPAEAALQQQVNDLHVQVQKLTDLAARAQADLQNAKARMKKDQEELGKFATEGLLKKLLPILENFQRAAAHLPAELANHEWVKGIVATEQSLVSTLADVGLRKLEVLGTVADTAQCEVLTMGDGPEGVVLEVFENGYSLHGKTLQPAKVKVGNGVQSAQ